MSTPLVSVGIPLYRSRPFLSSLRDNCAALVAEDNVEVIISDRHGLDDTLDVLCAEWGHDARFRFLKDGDCLNWVEHMNFLLREARGDYFRWMPHDDCFPAGCLTPLIERLETTSSVILAYGPTRAIDAAGLRTPQRDRLRSYPVSPGQNWTFQHSLDLFWKGFCDGAFKGLFRRRDVINAGLLIRPTHRLVHAERTWLFGVSLLGGWLRNRPQSTSSAITRIACMLPGARGHETSSARRRPCAAICAIMGQACPPNAPEQSIFGEGQSAY